MIIGANEDFRIDYVELPVGMYHSETFLDDLTIKERTEVFALIEVVKTKMNNSERLPTSNFKAFRQRYIELRLNT